MPGAPGMRPGPMVPGPAGWEPGPMVPEEPQSAPVGDEEREIQAWEARLRLVQTAEALQRAQQHKWRQLLAGEPRPEVLDPALLPDGAEVDGVGQDGANIIHSMFASALPLIYDSTADVKAAPALSVDDLHYELSRKFSLTLSVVLKRRFVKDAKLRARMRALARSTMPASLGWVKMAYVRDYETQPHFRSRPEDAQDEIARLRSLSQRIGETTDHNERLMMAGEIKALQESLFEQRDVVVDEGLVIDLLAPNDVVVSPEVVCLASDYREAEWIGQGIWLTVEEAAARFQISEVEMRGVRGYGPGAVNGADMTLAGLGGSQPGSDIVDGAGPRGGGEPGRVRAWELWHKSTGRILSIVEGLRRWARPVMRAERRPQRFYPFYCLAFNPVEHRRYPLSDVALLSKLQDEFHALRRKFMKHRDATIPKTAIDGTQLDAGEAQKFIDAPVGATVALGSSKERPEAPLENAFFAPRYPLPDPALYDTGSVFGDMQRVYGMGEASRGGVVTPKTAREATIEDQATKGRMGERTDEIVALEEEMAQDATEILLQELSLEAVQRIAGAGAVWPMMDRKTIWDMVSITVMHESKADRERKQQIWMEIAPMVMSLQMEIAQLRMMGLSMLAEPKIEVLRETLRRYDDRIDIERFLPGGPVQAGVPLPRELEDAAAGGVSPVTAQQLAMLQGMMGQGQQGQPGGGGRPSPGGPGGPGQSSGYNPGAGGMGRPAPQGASNQPSGVT